MRPLRRSPLYDRLRDKGAVFGSKMGWERAELFPAARRRAAAADARHARLAAATCWRSSARAARTSSCSTRRRSPNSCSRAATRWRCCSGRARTRSTSRRAAWCTRRCSTRAAASKATSRSFASARSEFFIITGSAQTTRDFAWIERGIRDGEHAALVDVGERVFRAVGDGPEGRGAAARAHRRRHLAGRAAVFDDARNRRRLCARARGADELRRRAGLRALRHHRSVRDALRGAVERRRAFRIARRRLLHDRRAAHRSRPPRVGRRALTRRDAVGGRTGLCREDGQAGAVPRPRGVAGEARRRGRASGS